MTEPRDPRELLGMLAARVQHFAMAPGGIPALTQLDIAHALGMISNPAVTLYARVKYGQENGDFEDLVQVLFRHVAVNLDIGKWRIPRKEFIQDMCALALAEDIDPCICTWCGGWGHAVAENKVVQCGQCKGTGQARVMDKDRAKIMRCTTSAWAHSWAERYKEVRSIPSRWDGIIEGALPRRLRRASSASIEG